MLTTKHAQALVEMEVSALSLDQSALSLIPSVTSQQYVSAFLLSAPNAASCSPPTPVGELNGYTSNIHRLDQRVVAEINAIGSHPLVMGPFAQAVNSLVSYVRSLPSEFCIGPSNQAAYDQLNAEIRTASANIQRGSGIFESNFESFVNQATPLLNTLYNECRAISSSSRDFTGVINSFRRYDSFVKQHTLDIWLLTQRIANLSSQLSNLINITDAALQAAVNQIESNVEAEARRFVDQNNLAEAAFRHWDTIDGKQGYERYLEVMRRVAQVMIPDFNRFLQKVPSTQRVQQAVRLAQQAIDHIDTGFASFPNLSSLPVSSTYLRYGSDDRKYGGAKVIAAIEAIASAYSSRTGHKLYIGDMQYEHGGKMGIHKSHKDGIDADVDGVEIGDVPNHDAAKALALAKDILSAGAKLVFYADQTTVTDANKWAADNNISGRLQIESAHKGHFHLRMPW